MKHRNRCFRGKDTHHIFPKSRFPQLKNENWNLIEINKYDHVKYHWLFQNRSPEEIIDWLVNYFWGGYTPKQLQGVSNGKGN